MGKACIAVHDVLVTHPITDVDVALAAAEAGAAVVRAAYGTDLHRHVKSGSDFATDADIKAEQAILAVIEAARPADMRIGEESGVNGGSGARRWLVDPLCGTLNFAAQTPLVAVNVALADDCGSNVAVCVDPIAGEVFWTDGRDAFLRGAGGADTALVPSGESRLVDLNCDGPMDRPFLGPQLATDPEFRSAFGTRVTSTTLAVAWAAAGRRAAYVSDGFFADNVHYAAGITLCRAAGCVVTDLAGGAVEEGRGLLVAADSATHDQVIQMVRPYLADLD